MGRPLRFWPESGRLVEVTSRTLHGLLLLRPGPVLNEIIIGALARAQAKFPVGIVHFCFLSNHFHLLLDVESSLVLSRFMGHFKSKLAKEVGRLTGWREKVFGRRYTAIYISNEEAAEVERLRYLLENSVKENLVARPQDWPGVHGVHALLTGEPPVGYWFDRTQEYAAGRRRETFDRLRYATREELTLAPLPCWEHLSPEQRQARVASLVAEIEAEAAAHREQTGIQPLGPAAILAQDPMSRPRHVKRSPAPRFHAASKAVRRELYALYREFVAAFRAAADLLRKGDPEAVFPVGSFPPALPFVGG